MKLKRISFLGLASTLLCLTLVTACGGETKQAQCEKVGDIINGLGSANPTDPAVMAKLGLSAADDLDALDLGDKKLSDLRSQLSQSLRAASDSTSKIANFAGADGSFDDSAQAQALVAQVGKSSAEFQSKIKETESYCRG